MLGETAIAALFAFVVTNLDDLALLILWFSAAQNRSHRMRIILGQYLGFLTLVGLSLPGWFGGQWIVPAWLGWLGLLPIGLGLRALFSRDEEDAPLPTLRGPGWSQITQVAAVTIANGGDNIGIYVPFFARQSGASLGGTLLTFLILVGLWCWLARWLIRHPTVEDGIQRYGDRLIPIGLIGLGLYIWIENQAWKVFG
jgi:cadmium resistance transport/sequestration family protein